jgi:Flp pilus assembly protein protease CpaA
MICNQWTTRFIVCCALPSSSFLVIFLNKSTILKIFAFAVMTIYFIVASLTDIETRQVYDFLFYIAVLAGIPLLLSQNQSPRSMVSLLLFCFLQLFFFSKMYGKADVMAFIVSALFETIQGGDFIIYILHMAITFTFLAIVQIIRGNINNKGNLKHPVAFLPYISLTIWPFLL